MLVFFFFFCTKRVAVRVTGADVFPLAFSQLATSAPAGTQQGPKAVQRQGTEKSPAREHLLGLSEHLQAPWSSVLKLGKHLTAADSRFPSQLALQHLQSRGDVVNTGSLPSGAAGILFSSSLCQLAPMCTQYERIGNLWLCLLSI